MDFAQKIKILLIFLILTLFLPSCGIYKPVDARKVSPDPKERVKKNIEEGRGFRLMGRKNYGDFNFATSNPLWRASLDILNFIPLSNADYNGGLIISDWYSENSDNMEIKITVKFLSNEIRADGIDIIIHKRICEKNNCKVTKVESEINRELKFAILKKAAFFKKKDQEKYAEENPYTGGTNREND